MTKVKPANCPLIHPIQSIDFTRRDQACLIEASAGSGKTWTIERLFIKALIERQDIGLEQILVVTFTNAATNELKTRLLHQLKTTVNWLSELKANDLFNVDDLFFTEVLANRKPRLDKDMAIILRAIQNFDHAAIYTIHGFCNKVVQNYQLECKVNQPFQLVNDKQEIILTLVRNFIRTKIINNPAWVNKIEQVYANLNMVLGIDYNTDIVEKIASKLPNDLFIFKDGKWQIKYQIKLNPNLDALAQGNILLVDRVEILANLLSSVIKYIAQYYEEYSRLTNSLSFDELIQIVANGINNSNFLKHNLKEDYPIAFIDEFQDTDNWQWQIFSNIYGLSAGKASGTIIMVGDPKQAIYRFRGADIGVYLAAQAYIPQHLELVENRRSHPHIMNFINNLFAANINPHCFGPGLHYTSLMAKVSARQLITLPSKQELANLCHSAGFTSQFYDEEVQLVVIAGKNAQEKENNLLAAMALEILALLNSNPTLSSKIAILVTQNSQADYLVNYLREYGIMACELKLGNIFATTTANDLYLILRAVLDLANRKLLLKALTTQLFNLPLIQLNALDELNKEVKPEKGKLSFQQLQQNFFRYKQAWEKTGIISLIYQLINDSILLHADNQHGVTKRELANLLQLGELLNKYAQGVTNPLEILNWFGQKIAKAKDNSDLDINGSNEELVRLDNDDEQVTITTQHKAKGLEYDIVFCPYFKSDGKINGNSTQYQLPFFASYKDENNKSIAKLITNHEEAQLIVANDNKEIHRLNYVALTRAKSRLYIYLKTPSLTKTNKYHDKFDPGKIAELFGYVKNNPLDNTHSLFNYPNFFTKPNLAIKNPYLLSGVIAYSRLPISRLQLKQLKLNALNGKPHKSQVSFFQIANNLQFKAQFMRQSYSQLTHSETVAYVREKDATDYFVPQENKLANEINYIYPIFNQLAGAKFGTLFHSLCQYYPLPLKSLHELLIMHNLDITYSTDLNAILDKVFNYRLMDNGLTLASLKHKLAEFKFNLLVKDTSLTLEVADLLASYYGKDHPYVIACQSLTSISQGFLNGFIDLFFEYQGKYYILDYKTNRLDDYSSTQDPKDQTNSLVLANAQNHYYLQYLLYLVAIKRHLQVQLKIANAGNLLGGAIYYYVRGLFVQGANPAGVYVNKINSNLICSLDCLLGGN